MNTNKPHWDCTYGTVDVLTDNDEGYDWSRKDEVEQLAWYPPKDRP